MAEHNSLYRKHRPDTFEKIIGQDFIVKTLKNQIKRGTVGHAYLFTGTRGTGKTSTAKVFAKAVNCETPVQGSPCGKCATCLELSKSNNMDVIEIDAASNNGVDEIRDLREKVGYRPAFAKKKVYIIDEVHMLTTAAYNALLKTLEEPPEHVIFILATTEVHKIPATILSRCLRFDFRLIPDEIIAKQIADIFTQSGIKYDDSAVRLIASAGKGSDRDALSFADMCISYSDGAVTYENVLEALGASDPTVVADIALNILRGETGKALELTAGQLSLGKSVSMLGSDIAGVLRDAVYIKTARDPNGKLKLSEPLFRQIEAGVKLLTVRRIVKALDVFTALDGDLRYSTQPRLVLEAAVVKAAENAGQDAKLDDALKRLDALENASGQKKNLSENAKKTQSDDDFLGGSISFSANDYDPHEVWAELTSRINAKYHGFLAIAMERATPSLSGGVLEVRAPSSSRIFSRDDKAKIVAEFDALVSGGKIVFIPEQIFDERAMMSLIREDFEDEVTIYN